MHRGIQVVSATPEKIVRSIYDGSLGVACLITWISPFALGRDAHEWLAAALLFQGVVVALTTVLLYRFDIRGPSGVVVAVIIAALALTAFLTEPDLRSFGLLIPFVWHIYNLYALTNSTVPTIERRMQITFSFWSVVFMVIAAMIVATLPVPRFGWANIPVSPALQAAGITPHKDDNILLAWGALYFLPMAVLKYYWRVGWPVPSFRGLRRTR